MRSGETAAIVARELAEQTKGELRPGDVPSTVKAMAQLVELLDVQLRNLTPGGKDTAARSLNKVSELSINRIQCAGSNYTIITCLLYVNNIAFKLSLRKLIASMCIFVRKGVGKKVVLQFCAEYSVLGSKPVAVHRSKALRPKGENFLLKTASAR